MIAAADRAARTQGLHPAMPLAHAMALVPDLLVADADPEGDWRALSDLAAWCLRWSPLTAPDPPDGVWIDATGCAHLHGGEQRMLDTLIGRLAAAGLSARAGLADTPGAAHAMARHGAGAVTVVAPGAQADALALLPMRALRIPGETADSLRQLGIDLVGQLFTMPRGPLARRFGEAWRRADVPPPALERLAEADAFRGLGLDWRQALWQVRGLPDAVLPLFAVADAGQRPRPELVEAPVPLRPMREGGEVVEDYRSTGLSLRPHPVAFLRATLQAQGMATCADLAHLRDGRRVVVPGIVLVRQKPGSAKDVMFITVEDETGVANLVLWPDRYARQRRLVLSAGMIACQGRVQREGKVVHVITDRLEDLSDLLRSVAGRDGDGTGPSSHVACGVDAPNARPSGIKVPTRDFR